MAWTTDDLETGGGILYIQDATEGEAPSALDWVDCGNCNQFSETPKITNKEHKSHRSAVARLDKSISVEFDCEIKFQLDQMNKENLALFFSGVLDGTTIKPLEAGTLEKSIKWVPHLGNGTERTHEWLRCQISAASGVELVNHGNGETDWAKMEFTARVLYTETPPAGYGYYGKIYVSPTE